MIKSEEQGETVLDQVANNDALVDSEEIIARSVKGDLLYPYGSSWVKIKSMWQTQ